MKIYVANQSNDITGQEHSWKQLQKKDNINRYFGISAAMLDIHWKDNFIHDSFVFLAVFRKGN
jgi:hypothetical protein